MYAVINKCPGRSDKACVSQSAFHAHTMYHWTHHSESTIQMRCICFYGVYETPRLCPIRQRLEFRRADRERDEVRLGRRLLSMYI